MSSTKISPTKKSDLTEIIHKKDLIDKLQRRIVIYRLTNNNESKIEEAENEINQHESKIKTLYEKYNKKYLTQKEQDETRLAQLVEESQEKTRQDAPAQVKRAAEAQEKVAANAKQDEAQAKARKDAAIKAQREAEENRIAEEARQKAVEDAAAQKVVAKKAAEDAAAQKVVAKKAAEDAAAQKVVAKKAAAQKAAEDAAAEKAAAQDITNQINNLDLSEEDFSQQKQQLLRNLRQMRSQQIPQIYKYTCENEPSSRVGIDSPNNNNCYLNALFQMLFHMCYFRRAIIDDNDTDFTPAIDELKYILYRYQQLYLQNQYKVLFLTDNDYFFIKEQARLDPLEDIQQDPMEILTTNDFFDGTHGIANNNIYNNPQSVLASNYVYQLKHDNDADINLKALIGPRSQSQDFFNGVEPNTEQKYIILNYPRFHNDAAKKQNSVIANSTINIKEVNFILKGIIVHLGPNTNSGHYIYVTFTNDGRQIDKIYNNSLVTDFNRKQTNVPDKQQKQKILQERVAQFNELMDEFINTFVSDQSKQHQLKQIQNDVFQKNYLLGFRKNSLNEAFETFKTLFNQNNPDADGVFKNETDKNTIENTIDFDSIQGTINRNGTIFLYENISSRPQPGRGAQGPPVTPGTPSITPAEKLQLQKATIAAMSLFKIPYNKTFFQIITKKELTNKKDNLLKEIKNNVTDSPAELKQIVNQAYEYLNTILDKIGNKIIGRALNHLPLELLDNFYTSLKKGPRDYLLAISSKFLELYKRLNYKKSMIIQTPKLNGTRKATQGTICNELGQLNPLFNSQKGIPSILRKLTRKITREEIYKPIKARIAIKEADTKKAAEKKSKQTIEQIDAAEKGLKEIKTQKIVERIGALSQEINVLRENPEITPKAINKKLGELRELKKLLESEEQQPPKKETRGGTNKIIRITKQNKKTRKLN